MASVTPPALRSTRPAPRLAFPTNRNVRSCSLAPLPSSHRSHPTWWMVHLFHGAAISSFERGDHSFDRSSPQAGQDHALLPGGSVTEVMRPKASCPKLVTFSKGSVWLVRAAGGIVPEFNHRTGGGAVDVVRHGFLFQPAAIMVLVADSVAETVPPPRSRSQLDRTCCRSRGLPMKTRRRPGRVTSPAHNPSGVKTRPRPRPRPQHLITAVGTRLVPRPPPDLAALPFTNDRWPSWKNRRQRSCRAMFRRRLPCYRQSAPEKELRLSWVSP